MKDVVKSIWTSFKAKPLKFGAGVFLLVISTYIFFGDVKFKAKHGDTTVEIETKG